MMKLFAASALALSLVSFSAIAQDEGPTIEGGVQLNISAEEDVSAAIGNKSSATQEIGAIDSGTIEGDTEIAVEAAQDVSAAIGNKSCSDQKIGTIGAKNAC
ncbi:hypothetical protein RYZ26_02455 [Terasakiella sp. A23]|uniref:hypothetical protein n=1 Tax=Terasakiella sp. FCG-A23 TaxID=3080561 RepID=UPI0029545DCE|nr:hypothetical protein [Terasakiella sp. A23]MDV7338442.1 hypothetical protein [Terasakiella sp. A23]